MKVLAMATDAKEFIHWDVAIYKVEVSHAPKIW
jgi:hypothetical protein